MAGLSKIERAKRDFRKPWNGAVTWRRRQGHTEKWLFAGPSPRYSYSDKARRMESIGDDVLIGRTGEKYATEEDVERRMSIQSILNDEVIVVRDDRSLDMRAHRGIFVLIAWG